MNSLLKQQRNYRDTATFTEDSDLYEQTRLIRRDILAAVCHWVGEKAARGVLKTKGRVSEQKEKLGQQCKKKKTQQVDIWVMHSMAAPRGY